jgi:hypothetical protein
MAIPAAELLSVLVTLIVVPIVVGDIVAVRTATTPSGIRFVFIPPAFRPVRKQV